MVAGTFSQCIRSPLEIPDRGLDTGPGISTEMLSWAVLLLFIVEVPEGSIHFEFNYPKSAFN